MVSGVYKKFEKKIQLKVSFIRDSSKGGGKTELKPTQNNEQPPTPPHPSRKKN